MTHTFGEERGRALVLAHKEILDKLKKWQMLDVEALSFGAARCLRGYPASCVVEAILEGCRAEEERLHQELQELVG